MQLLASYADALWARHTFVCVGGYATVCLPLLESEDYGQNRGRARVVRVTLTNKMIMTSEYECMTSVTVTES